MTETLSDYLEKSREKRKEITKFAESVQQGYVSSGKSQSNIQKLDFPNPNPIRFKEFQENLQKDLQSLYQKPKILKEIPKTRSISLKRSDLSSAYSISKPKKKRISVLPPILHKNESYVIENFLRRRLEIEDPVQISAKVLESIKNIHRNLTSRFDVKKQLLIPVLTRRNEK